jgi:hypothetical protein
MPGGRPARAWVRKTYTVSEKVEEVIRIKAAELDVDPGTVVDILVWNAYIKPDQNRLQQGGFSEDELERIFAEEVLSLTEKESVVEEIADCIDLDPDAVKNLRKIRAMIKRWRKTRKIEKEYQRVLLSGIESGNWCPSIFRSGLVEEDWFEADE